MEPSSSSGSVLNSGKRWFLKTISLGKFRIPNYGFCIFLVVLVFGVYKVYSQYVFDYNKGLVAGISKKISPTPCPKGGKCPAYTLTPTPTPLPTGAASLDIALSPLAASGAYVKGTPNVNVVAFLLTAGTEDVHVNGVTLNGLAGPSNGSLGSNYASLASMLANLRLYDGSGTLIPALVTSNNLPTTGAVTFGNMDWVIPTGIPGTLLLKVDLSNNTPDANDTFSFDLESTANIAASTSTPGEIVNVSGADLNGSSTATVAITVSNGGLIAVSQGPASPAKSAVYWGQTNVPFSQFRFTGTNEAFYIEKLTIATLDRFEATGAAANAKTIYLTYRNIAGSILTVSQLLSGGASASFAWTAPVSGGTDTRPYIAQNSSLDASVAVDMRTAAEGASSGVNFSLDFSNTYNGSPANGFRAIGASSGQVINGSSPGITDVMGVNNQYVYRAFPKLDIIALQPPYNLVGSPTVFKFSVTAMGLSDSKVFFDNQALGSGSIRFEVIASGGYQSSAVSSSFTVYDDNGTVIDTITTRNDFKPLPHASLSLDFGHTGTGQDVEITGGQSKTFRIQFDNPGVHYGHIGNYFQLVLRDDENGLINWVDNFTGSITNRDSASVAGTLRNLPMNGPVFQRQTASIWGKLFGFIGKLF
ncbi:MAG: hypothetical protein A2750_00630 [Candidatus Yanofskybacteria bacterium RIFCSPHIGHO2_01_FULL_45_42]|uniref:Uncharacterized protein n=3 Tax=Candidatus Yanofskyibacteriota TaxID=1752733 RepID=A0A1F8F6R5_9BACT|nr:MAG: hypothetical protein A2750_00630 [Candidatus Yanofskybacteria bacterium RIFCSPHIGHO2_01_FULL_45_42]OGN16375.1 MAG: hypothetical protein A3C81_02860 [Candidatus Yanofskybacteria bacterium RIFCSPHIGHO2_02_FULL_46_19]OGN26840.1 MAG: hypothetical protein A3B17_00375 [Candidatus Yanofskybacteria bacterium RIFCSPLOWO2_01_FULL_45_72]OGN32374.1 MAG: hypothetical protein A3J01_00420 [Candidatus Yanofskybacteria bacterium RIFCSPLOWO2_02_FULL_45_18]